METSAIIIKALKETGKPMKAGEISEKTGIDKKEVEKAIKKLVQDEKMYSPTRCYYDVKK
ncbi:MAG: MarR family transcriptional regulator [Bacteroidetes bacterium]|nr:MarR family transcriptional regulator [Bacteroidota bacterium]